MSLTQFQIIQSLGKSLEWLQTELAWGAQAQELRHLTGRIGELYTAMITYGQMASENNQRGYDVVSNCGERISVKTITSSTFVTFNKATFQFVDRVIILKINTIDLAIEILLDERKEEFLVNPKVRIKDNSYEYPTYSVKSDVSGQNLENLEIISEAKYNSYTIKQYENGAISVSKNGMLVDMMKPILRDIADGLQVSLYNSAGVQKNTRQLGDHIIKDIHARMRAEQD